MTTDGGWFSEIGAAYAQRFTELEAARGLFREERRTILERLASVVREATDVTHAVESGCYVVFYVPTSAWSRHRKPMGKPHRAGFAFAMGAIPYFGLQDSLTFAAYCFFEMRAKAAFASNVAPRLPDELRSAVDHSSGYVRVPVSVIAADNERFALEQLEAVVGELPSKFGEVDVQITQAYAAAMGASPVE